MFKKLLVRDIKMAIKDRLVMFNLLFLPILLVTILSFAFSGTLSESKPLTVIRMGVVFDIPEKETLDYLKEASRISHVKLVAGSSVMLTIYDIQAMDFKQLILNDLLDSPTVKRLISTQQISKEEGLKAVKSGKLDAVIIFDENFYGNYIISSVTPLKSPAAVKIVAGNHKSLNKHIAETIMPAFAKRMEQAWNIDNLELKEVITTSDAFDPKSTGETMDTLFKSENLGHALTFETQLLKGRKPITSSGYYTMAMLTMFLLFTAGYGSHLMFADKESFYFQNLQIDATSKWYYLFSKFCVMYIIGMVQFLVMFIFSVVALKIQWGDLIGIFIIANSVIFAISSMGLMLAVYTMRVKNFKLINMLETFFFPLMAFLGGSFMPLSILPGIFTVLSRFTVNGLALKALLMNMQSYHYTQYRLELMYLALIGSIFLSVAVFSFSGQVKRENSKA